VSDAKKRENTCPLEEYVRRSTGEIVENISRVYLSRAEWSHWRDKVSSVCLTPRNENIVSFKGICSTGEIVVNISRVYSQQG